MCRETVGALLEGLGGDRAEAWADSPVGAVYRLISAAECFGDVPQMVFHEGNSVVHKLEYEGDPGRRPLIYDEVRALFHAADARPGTISRQDRKGALCAARDAAVLKTVYAFGLRRTEASHLDVTDLRRNHKVPRFGEFGTVMVRYGKASCGIPTSRI